MLEIKFKKLTDFEKLLYAQLCIKELRKKNKELEFDNGVMASEIDELSFYNKNFRKSISKKDKQINKLKLELYQQEL